MPRSSSKISKQTRKSISAANNRHLRLKQNGSRYRNTSRTYKYVNNRTFHDYGPIFDDTADQLKEFLDREIMNLDGIDENIKKDIPIQVCEIALESYLIKRPISSLPHQYTEYQNFNRTVLRELFDEGSYRGVSLPETITRRLDELWRFVLSAKSRDISKKRKNAQRSRKRSMRLNTIHE